MESGLTRDGRATTVSHTRFGRARRPRFISTLYIYLGASQPFLRMYGILARGRGRRAGCGVCPGVHGGYGTAPGARRNRAGSERPYTKVPPPCQSPLRASSAVARARVPAHAPRFTPAVRPRGDRASALLWHRPPRREEDVPRCPLADFRVSLSPCAMRRCGPGRRCAPAEG